MIYKAVIFDSGGVLHPTIGAPVLKDIAQELGLSPDRVSDLLRLVRDTIGLGTIPEAEFWQKVSRKYDVRLVSPNENLLGRAYANKLRPRKGIYSLINELRRQDIVTAVLSNTIEPHSRANLDAGLFEPFDKLFLSQEAHLRKPDPEFYLYALKELGVSPQEALFIDDRKENIDAAVRLGIRSILYTTEQRIIDEIRALTLPRPSLPVEGAITLLVRIDGAFILQQRDNNPDITLPGGITGFGGSLEPGETPLIGALRELREETNLAPSPYELDFFGQYRKTLASYGEDRTIWVFVLSGVNDKSLEVYEGQGFVILKDLDTTGSMPLSRLVREVISDYAGDSSK